MASAGSVLTGTRPDISAPASAGNLQNQIADDAEMAATTRKAGVKSAAVNNPELASLGNFKADPLNVGTLGRNVAAAQRLVDRVGWK